MKQESNLYKILLLIGIAAMLVMLILLTTKTADQNKFIKKCNDYYHKEMERCGCITSDIEGWQMLPNGTITIQTYKFIVPNDTEALP